MEDYTGLVLSLHILGSSRPCTPMSTCLTYCKVLASVINGGIDIAMKKKIVKYESPSYYRVTVCIFAVKGNKIIIIKIKSIYLLSDFPPLGPIPAGSG